jgi:hypothetical protein
MIMQAIVGATGIVTKGLKKNLEVKTGKHSVDSVQNTTVRGTSRVGWEILQSET